jgi:hypothetical protein
MPPGEGEVNEREVKNPQINKIKVDFNFILRIIASVFTIIEHATA